MKNIGNDEDLDAYAARVVRDIYTRVIAYQGANGALGRYEMQKTFIPNKLNIALRAIWSPDGQIRQLR